MATPNDPQRMERIVSLCKRRGFIFQASEIYGGLNGVWDFGPLGTELKRNLKDYWWRVMVRERDDVVRVGRSNPDPSRGAEGKRPRRYFQRSDGGLLAHAEAFSGGSDRAAKRHSLLLFWGVGC